MMNDVIFSDVYGGKTYVCVCVGWGGGGGGYT